MDDLTFEGWLYEWKRFVYSKDGVRKQVKTDREAEEWKNTIAKPKKEPKAKAAGPKAGDYDWKWIARQIEMEVGNHFPDSDGWDTVAKHVMTKYPELYIDTVHEVLNKAAKKELGVKDFHGYVDQFHKEHGK